MRGLPTQVGFEQGMRSLSSFGVQGPTQGFVTVTLTDRDHRTDTVWDIEARIREGIAKVPGIEVATVRETGNTARATTSAPVVVQITGDDPLVLDRLGLAVEKPSRSGFSTAVQAREASIGDAARKQPKRTMVVSIRSTDPSGAFYGAWV